MKTFSIAIATYNRAAELAATLASLSRIETPAQSEIELIVVDNNSPDDTAAVVERARSACRFPLRYEVERVQGRSAALNRAFAVARGDVVMTTDDDVRVPADWAIQYDRAFTKYQCGYVGGRVLPIWGAPPPRWLSKSGGPMWATIALLDFGDEPHEFSARVPLGVNMAFTRDALGRVGGFDPRIGRKAGTLLGQEVREWGLRARAAGVRGMYVPAVVLEHLIPAERLRKWYFRRWFYWRGISRALLYGRTGHDMEHPEQTSLDYSTVPHVLGVPRYMFRSAIVAASEAAAHALRRRSVQAFERELWVWFFAGILRQRWSSRELPPARQPDKAAAPLQG